MRRRVTDVLVIVVVLSAAAAPSARGGIKVGAPEALAKALRTGFEPAIERVSGGEIDWTAAEATAVGTAKVAGEGAQAVAMAKRASRLIAARNAALVIAGLRPGPDGRVKNLKTGRISVDAVLAHFSQVYQKHDARKKTVTTKIRMPLYGVRGVVQLLGVSFARSDKRWEWPPEGVGAGRADVVIIDARGSSFQPSVVPRIVTANGRCVFAGGDLAKAKLADRPAVAYVGFQMNQPRVSEKNPSGYLRAIARARKVASQSGAQPRDLGRVARKKFRSPLIFSGLATRKDSRETIVLPNPAVRTMALHPEIETLLKAGKVVFVIDRPGRTVKRK